ncbi:helix-turn-helix domain-containing protein [Streptomyces sp. NPDC002920]
MTFEPQQLGQSKTDLAEKLRELRKRAGLTGDRLARRCNMSQSQISKFETGYRGYRPCSNRQHRVAGQALFLAQGDGEASDGVSLTGV